MKYLIWYVIWQVMKCNGEWVELPKLNPFSTKNQKLNKNESPPIQRKNNQTNKEPVTLDYNLEQLFLQVHRTLAMESERTVDKKENFLQNLQKKMLSDIWGKSHTLWSRTGIEGRAHGQMMSFPSLEGALMTISFLTFAVFLIKIVKQFIQGLQGANGSVVGIELPGTMVTPAKVIKHKRNINDDGFRRLDTNLLCLKEKKFYSQQCFDSP